MAEKTTTGRIVAAIGGIVLIISLFLNWIGVDLGGLGEQFGAPVGALAESFNVDASFSGWQALEFGDIVFFVVGLFAIAPAVFDIFDMEIELPFDVGMVALIGGVLSVLWIVLRILDKPDGAGLKIGIFLGLVGAIAVAVGGFLQQGDTPVEEYSFATPGAVPPATGPPPTPQPPAGGPPQPPQAPPPPAV